MIQGIFYARFLPQQGTKIIAQAPPGCIVAEKGISRDTLFDFETLQGYIFPKPAFFNRYMTIQDPDGKYTILSHPVCIRDTKYYRNEFIFNFGIVVEAGFESEGDDRGYGRVGSGRGGGGRPGGRGDAGTGKPLGGEGHLPYEMVVRRLAQTFAEMEKQNEYLSQEGGTQPEDRGSWVMGMSRRPIESLLEIIKEDLNNYGECMIPVDEANTINMKLFPHHPVPPPIRGWHVPIPKTKLSSLVDPTWDLTLQRLIPFIDGVSDVRRIAYLAEVSLDLAQCALRHLLRYDTILILDTFFFGNCYAARPTGIHEFIANRDGIVEECAAYCCISPPPAATARMPSSSGTTGTTHTRPPAHGGPSTSSSTAILSPGMPTTAVTGPSSSSSRIPPSTSSSTSPYQTHHRPHPHHAPPSGIAASVPKPPLPNYLLIKLMTTFCPGRTVMEWLKLHQDNGFHVLHHIDVRRFVQFGMIKGLLYRVHKWVISKQYIAGIVTGVSYPGSTITTATTTVATTSTTAGEGKPGQSSASGNGGGGRGGSLKARSSGRERMVDVEGAEDKGKGKGRERLESSDSPAIPTRLSSSRGRPTSSRRGQVAAAPSSSLPSAEVDEPDDAAEQQQRSITSSKKNRKLSTDPLQKYVDGCHNFDQIITERNMTDGEIMERLKKWRPSGDLTVFYR